MATMNGQEDALMDLINTKHWKSAFNLCEKKIKKAPGSDYLLVTRIKILLSWGDTSRSQQGLKDLESLLERKPPVADVEALRILDTIFTTTESPKQFTIKQKQTWQRAIASRPQDESLQLVWYKSRFNEGDFKGAQQAAISWMKNAPQERKPYFLYILNTYLVSIHTSDERERSLMQSLAYQHLLKGVTQIPRSNGETTAHGRHIQTMEDRYLLVRVFRDQGRYAEIAQILSDQSLGIPSVFGGYRWELAKRYMEVLKMQENWEGLYTMCRLVLENARDRRHTDQLYDFGELGDDWQTWQMFIEASNKFDTEKNSSATEALIKSSCGQVAKASERNPRIAFLLFCSLEVFEGRKSPEMLLSAITDYFRDFSTKIVCFSDLQNSLPYLDSNGQKQLLEQAAKYAQGLRPQSRAPEFSVIFWITSEINVLKLEYNLVVSQDCNSHRSDLLATFVANCLRLYKKSIGFEFDLPVSDRRPGDDAALLAAMGLIRLFKMGKKHALLQCILVLEHSLLHSKHNYDALLILVRLYMFLGAGSLAMERYHRLSIKNIQHTTISWVLYTRLSSIHPYPAIYPGERGTFNPVKEMSNAFDWHRSADGLSRNAIHSMQERGQWNMVLDTLDANRAIVNGFTRCLFNVEVRRIERIAYRPRSIAKEHYHVPMFTEDQRDRSAFPNFEGGGLTFEQHLPTVGSSSDPNDAWLQHELFLSWLWDVLHHGYSEINEKELHAMGKGDGWNRDSFTAAENATANIAKVITQLSSLHIHPDRYQKKVAQDVIVQSLEGLHAWLAQCSENLTSSTASGKFPSISITSNLAIPLWSFYHELFSYIEQCKFIGAAVEYVLAENRKVTHIDHQSLSKQAEALRSAYAELESSVWASATAVRQRLRDPSFVQQLTETMIDDTRRDGDEAMIVEAIKNLGNQPEMERVCDDLKDSWVEGLGVVLHAKHLGE